MQLTRAFTTEAQLCANLTVETRSSSIQPVACNKDRLQSLWQLSDQGLKRARHRFCDNESRRIGTGRELPLGVCRTLTFGLLLVQGPRVQFDRAPNMV